METGDSENLYLNVHIQVGSRAKQLTKILSNLQPNMSRPTNLFLQT